MMRRNIPKRRKMKKRVIKRWIKRKRKKVKMRKRKQREKVVDLSDQLREAQEISEATKRKSDDQKQHVYLEHLEEKKSGRGQQTQQTVEFQHADKGLFLERNSWFVSLSCRGL